jgi:predicted nucleotidyltransferase
MDQSLQYTVKFEETERYMSATRIRQAIRENDIDTFKQLTPEVLWDEWDTLRSLMCPVQEDVVTTGSIEITDKQLLPKKKSKKVKSFKEFLSTSKE